MSFAYDKPIYKSINNRPEFFELKNEGNDKPFDTEFWTKLENLQLTPVQTFSGRIFNIITNTKRLLLKMVIKSN